jgi:YfiH family protein
MLRQPGLARCGVAHGFGVRGAAAPPGLLRPRQVHGSRVVTADECREDPPPEADAVISFAARVPVGVVTADCVPLLIASQRGDAVAAVHAGWRGLAAGVVPQSVDALRRAGCGGRLVAAIGPHIGPCCYEVDGPVIDALGASFGAAALDGAVRPARAGHALLDLGRLTAAALHEAGLRPEDVGTLPGCCTRCDPARFHSYRRDGVRAGRLTHFVSAREA